MRNRVLEVRLSADGILKAIGAVAEYQAWLKEKTRLLLDRLAQEGYQLASAKFAQAVYDGTNDSTVTVEERGEKVRAVVAIGKSVLFIEFGTGVRYPDNHPEASSNGMIRGGYGKGHGKQQTWGYYGEPGTNGQVVKNGDKGQLVLTHGNPANMPMYETVKELKMRLSELVREVFR